MAGTFLKLGEDPKLRGSATATGHVGWTELHAVSWGWHESRGFVDLVPDGGVTMRVELHKALVQSISTSPDRDGRPNTVASLRAERITITSAAPPPAPRAAR